jgi:hypothetical protein
MGRLAANQNGRLKKKKTILNHHSKKEGTVNFEEHDGFKLFISPVTITTDTILGPNQYKPICYYSHPIRSTVVNQLSLYRAHNRVDALLCACIIVKRIFIPRLSRAHC